MAKTEPPRLAVMLLGWRLSKSNFEAIAGDLMEEFAARKHSRWWFWKHALSTLPRRFNFSAADHETGRSWQNPLASVFPDLRYAFRTLARTPTLTAAVLIATALGIGVNTGIFTLLNALVLRPLPAKDSGHVLSIYQELRNIKSRSIHGNRSLVSWSEYEQYRDNNEVLSGLAAYAPFEASFGSAAGVRQVQGQLVSCNYFTILGRAPFLGRNFSSADCKSPGANPYIIVSHVFWRAHLGGDATVLDKPVVVNRHKFTIAGVAPEGFPGTGMIVTDFWAPITMQEQLVPGEQYLADANLSWLYLLGRLKPGRSVAEARANLDVIAKRIDQAQAPRETKLIIHVASLFSMPEARQVVLSVGAVVMIAVGLVLLIACANVANLLLSRASARQREIAIRLSIGATRARLIQQLLTESLLLAVAGGVLGAVVSLWTFDVFYRWVFSQIPPEVPSAAVNLSPDVRVFGYCLVLSLATGIAFGLAPALQATRLDLNRVLKQEGRTAGWRSRGWLRSALLTAQVSVCLLLLVSAGLITRGLIAAQARDPGFRMHDVATASFDLNRQGYDEARAAHFYQVLAERLRSQPGVRAVALAEVVPLSGSRHGNAGHLEGRDGWVQLIYNRVSPEYFELLDIPIVRGRGFGPSETSRDAVMIVSESTARRFWPGTDPIGKKIRFGEDQVYKEVIGVAKDVYATNLFEVDGVFVYMPVHPGGLLSILVEAQDPAAVTRQIRAIAAGVDRNLFVNATPLKQRLRLWETPSRILTVLASALGLFALLLAATGIFGVVNYGVGQRTHEIGTRMALGANGPDILRLVISQSLRPVLVGAVFGLAGAAAASRILSKLLFGISPLDPASFLGMSLVLIAVTCLASYGPAYRAIRIDPAAALRHE